MSLSKLVLLLGTNVEREPAKSFLASFPSLASSATDLASTEGMPREHYLSDRAQGLSIRHSESGEIQVVFLMGWSKDGFGQYQRTIDDQLTFASNASSVVARFGKPDWSVPAQSIPTLGTVGETLRYDFPAHSIHFQFLPSGNGIAQITLSLSSSTPGRHG